RGIRGPLRDAILADAMPAEARGRAFGFHRAADTVGAIFGPLAGVALLDYARRCWPEDPQQPCRVVFWATLVPGALSVLSFALLVADGKRGAKPKLEFLATVRTLPASFFRLLFAVLVFGMGDFAPTLLVLAATQLLAPRFGLLEAAQV